MEHLAASAIDLSWTVNDAIARHPSTVAVFNDFGIDACCGGAVSIEEAAVRDGADPGTILEALRRAIAGT